MNREISTVAWVILGLLVVLIVLFNLALISTFLGRNRRKPGSPPPGPQPSPYKDLERTIRRPWHKEEEMLDELSQRVAAMQKNDPDPPPGGKDHP